MTALCQNLFSQLFQKSLRPFFLDLTTTLAEKRSLFFLTRSNFYQHFTHGFFVQIKFCAKLSCTVKPVYNDHPREPKFVAVVDRLSLFRGCFMLLKKIKTGPRNGSRCRQVVVIRRWSLTKVSLYLHFRFELLLAQEFWRKCHKMLVKLAKGRFLPHFYRQFFLSFSVKRKFVMEAIL